MTSGPHPAAPRPKPIKDALADGLPSGGWNFLVNAPKWHWFDRDSRSLCRRWMMLGGQEDAKRDQHDSPDNCPTCRKKLQKYLDALASKAAAEGVQP